MALIEGRVRDQNGNPLPNLSIQCFDQWIKLRGRLVAETITDVQGEFRIGCEPSDAAGEGYEVNFDSNSIVKASPQMDIFILVTDRVNVLYRSETRYKAKEKEEFDIVINSDSITFDDPYSNTVGMEISSILRNAVNDAVDMTIVDPHRTGEQMTRILGNLLYYNLIGVQRYGYPGPLVPRRPKQNSHEHIVPWKARHERLLEEAAEKEGQKMQW